MESKTIRIKNGQRLSDVYNRIESNTILCKFLTGIGATHIELKTARNSILIEPNVPPIKNKCSNEIYRENNLFGVYKGVKVDDIIEYLDKTEKDGSFIKILTTPESFKKVLYAFNVSNRNIYNTCFLLFDECHKIIQDVDYRDGIALPVDDFFKFKNKAFVSATPIIPSDPRFEEQQFTVVSVEPNYIKGRKASEYPNIKGTPNEAIYKDVMVIPPDIKLTDEHHDKLTVSLVPTNNVLEALKIWLNHVAKSNKDSKHPFCFFINSTTLILQIIKKLGIEADSAVFCADKSVKKLQLLGFDNAHEDWLPEYTKRYMFFTSRFYNALDIELPIRPYVFFLSIPFFSDYTLLDPATDIKQAVGRFRNGVAKIVHITNLNKECQKERTREDIETYIDAMALTYNTIKILYEDATTLEAKSAFKSALDILPYNSLLKNGTIDYFAMDNFIHGNYSAK